MSVGLRRLGGARRRPRWILGSGAESRRVVASTCGAGAQACRARYATGESTPQKGEPPKREEGLIIQGEKTV